MLTKIKIQLKNILPYIPLFFALVVSISFFYFYLTEWPVYDDKYEVKPDNQFSVSLTIAQITNANQFLISIVTALFGVSGYFLNQHRKYLSIFPLAIAYFMCLFLLGFGYYTAFRVYSTLINNLSYNAVAFAPERSHTFFFLESQFRLCLGASFTLLCILLVVFVESQKSKSR